MLIKTFYARSRSPIEDRRYEKYSHESSGSRSPSPSPSRDMFKSAMYSSGAGLTHMDRSPSPERSLSPIRRTPTSSVTSDKLANGLTHHDSVQQPNAIASAIQNLLQGGNNASMQQVRQEPPLTNFLSNSNKLLAKFIFTPNCHLFPLQCKINIKLSANRVSTYF